MLIIRRARKGCTFSFAVAITMNITATRRRNNNHTEINPFSIFKTAENKNNAACLASHRLHKKITLIAKERQLFNINTDYLSKTAHKYGI